MINPLQPRESNGQFGTKSCAEAPGLGRVEAMSDYRVQHQAPGDDGYSNPITRIADSFGDDVLKHPENHGSGEVDPETMAQLRAVAADPSALVTIYRAVPPGVSAINDGDWVTLSRAYAEQHAIHDDNESNDWPIIEQRVPATAVFSDGNDLAEYGYVGPDIVEHPSAPPTLDEVAVCGKDPIAAAATLAILHRTARAELASRFIDSGIDAAELGRRVGHSERVARRVVAGKEPLNETSLTSYFRAMSVGSSPVS